MEEGAPESPDSAQDSGEPHADQSPPLEFGRSAIQPVQDSQWRPSVIGLMGLEVEDDAVAGNGAFG
jgi:hypothetical protein